MVARRGVVITEDCDDGDAFELLAVKPTGPERGVTATERREIEGALVDAALALLPVVRAADVVNEVEIRVEAPPVPL